MADPYPIRPAGPDEFDAFYAVDQHAFHGRALSERRRAALVERFEFDRTLAAFDGGTPVGISGIYSMRLCVPGAMVSAAGVTFVAVLPTHRRRGILTSLMRRQLAAIAERGEAVAILWSSEAGIYGRYGYGPASQDVSLTFRRGDGALASRAAAAEPGLRLRIAEPESVRPELAKVHDTALPSRPGMFARDEWWWDRQLNTPEDGTYDGNPLRCLLAEDGGGPRGYALYTGKSRWDEETFLPDSAVSVREMIAIDPAATAAIWADLLSRDLATEFTAHRPVDDPLLHMLADPRRARPRLCDALWVRLVDVPGALAQRRYACPVDVVVEVADPLLPRNTGRWRLVTSGGPGASPGFEASCEPAGAPADLGFDVASLGAAYLGGTRLGGLAGAGLVTEHRPGALAALSAAMSWDPAPWCPVIF